MKPSYFRSMIVVLAIDAALQGWLGHSFLEAEICVAQELEQPIKNGADARRYARNHELAMGQLRVILTGNDAPKTTIVAWREYRTATLLPTLQSLERIPPDSSLIDRAISHLTLFSTGWAGEGQYMLTDWPAADALVKIGSIVYPNLYRRLDSPCDDLELALIGWIVYSIDGTRIAPIRIEDRIAFIQGLEKLKPNTYNYSGTYANLRKLHEMLSDPAFPSKYNPTQIREKRVTESKLPLSQRERPWERPWE